MRVLTEIEIQEISGSKKFKFHFNLLELVPALVVGALTAGPVGVGYVIDSAIIVQGLGELHDMGVEEFGRSPVQ